MLCLYRTWFIVLVTCLLASCAQPSLQPEPSRSEELPRPIDTRGAVVYAIDAQDSSLHILVYRGGTLARLGHNHVVSSKSISGRAWVHSDFTRSGFEISVPVHSLIIDDAEARASHGEDFAAIVPQKDIDGTRRNMMKPEVLDGERFAEIAIASAQIAGTPESPKVLARIKIKDVVREMEIPLNLKVQQAQLTASGEFDLLQTEFGMKPFSIALGALEVQDRLHIVYDITARKTSDGVTK